MHVNCIARLGLILMGLAAFGLAAMPATLAQTIDTTPQQNGSIGSFGVGTRFGQSETATFGQTITAPTTSFLQDFTFIVGNFADNGSAPIQTDAEVYAYNSATNMAIGPALYRSAPFTITLFPMNVLTSLPYTATPNVPVTKGRQYLLLFTTSGLQAGQPTSDALFGGVFHGTYTGGTGVFLGNGDDRNQLTTASYIPVNNFNLSFKADFGPSTVSVVPESSGLANLSGGLLALGAAGLVLCVRRRAKPVA